MASIAQIIEPWSLPPPNIYKWDKGNLSFRNLSSVEKIKYYVPSLFHLILILIALPAISSYWVLKDVCLFTKNIFFPFKDELQAIAVKPPRKPINFATLLSGIKGGYAGSGFQDNGIGSQQYCATEGIHGESQWGPFLTPEHIDKTRKKDFPKFFTNILGDPDALIHILKNSGHKGSKETVSKGVDAYRFSLEWAVIEPKQGEGYDQKQLALYHRLIQKLRENGIEPYVTIHHFTHPLWFEKLGGFKYQKNCSLFKKFALDMMKEFKNEVKYFYTFNEINAFALELLLKDHPSQINTINQTAKLMRNMLITHCQIYYKAKQSNLPACIGITHQWLKLYPINHNLLENSVCYLTSKITHWALYNFFTTGKFKFQVALQSNVQFIIDRKTFLKNNGFLDHIGMQFYGPAHIILGGNGGIPFPGHRIYNFCFKPLKAGLSFGGTCPRGKRVMSFGPTVDPEALTANLQEACKIPCVKNSNRALHISELGVDASTQGQKDFDFVYNTNKQKKIFKEYASILYPFKHKIGAIFFWTLLHGHLEWQRGHSTLGLCKVKKDKQRKIKDFAFLPAGRMLQKAFYRRHTASNF